MRGLAVLSFFIMLAMAPAADAATAEATIPAAARIEPAALAAMLGKTQPVILQVGSQVMYTQAHIPGSQYAGPGAKDEGIENLKSHAAGLPRDRLLVIYCGCCPWGRCPNVGPAFEQLHAMGFTQVKVLYLANNFGDDWVNKGYPAERGG